MRGLPLKNPFVDNHHTDVKQSEQAGMTVA
jgi:hypothetical protein